MQVFGPHEYTRTTRGLRVLIQGVVTGESRFGFPDGLPGAATSAVGCVRDARPLAADRLPIAVRGASRTHHASNGKGDSHRFALCSRVVGGESFRRRMWMRIVIAVNRVSGFGRKDEPVGINGNSLPRSSPKGFASDNQNAVGCVRDARPLTSDRLPIAIHGASRTHPTAGR